MKIAHISIASRVAPFTLYGGAVQRRVAELAREQARRGSKVTVLAPGPAAIREIDGVSVRALPSRLPAPWSHLEFQARCAAVLGGRRGRPDIIHVHNEPETSLVTKAIELPTVLSYDNFYFRRGHLKPVIRRALQAYDLLLPVSDYCRSESVAYWNLGGERVRVLPNGVNTDQFAPAPEAAAAERAAFDGPVALYLGRICRQKGVHTLLDAAALLREQGVQVNLVLAGPIGQFGSRGSDEASEWERRIADSGVSYLGNVPDDRLAALLTMCDVFVMPTLELEMQGMAALEAQACGTPVIASDHGGLRETVQDGSGVRFPPGDADALAGTIAGLIADDSARREYSARALEHSRSLSWQKIVDRLEVLYEEALAPR